jgi:ribosomal-protein-alanine N-acetyltransferase
MVSPFAIRPASVADVAALAAAEKRCFSDPWSAEALAGLFEQESVVALIGERLAGQTGLAGYLVARAVVDEAEVLNIAVVPEERGRGLGGQLLDQALTTLKSRGGRSVFLEVRASNQVAQALYRSRGFSVIACRANYYERPREDALVYRWESARAFFR